ncbi:hypothetical protein Y5W_02894 [Alcanivorax sp. 521-1]|uniref:DUF1737 domain-containing protein n=1 Tax=Alloalcanivorax profundimaris TaxID=2735259 RepID=A0ABS0AUE8_9GAMM|nr:hypothetical protein [Alloalcanivorax profundimaris]
MNSYLIVGCRVPQDQIVSDFLELSRYVVKTNATAKIDDMPTGGRDDSVLPIPGKELESGRVVATNQ